MRLHSLDRNYKIYVFRYSAVLPSNGLMSCSQYSQVYSITIPPIGRVCSYWRTSKITLKDLTHFNISTRSLLKSVFVLCLLVYLWIHPSYLGRSIDLNGSSWSSVKKCNIYNFDPIRSEGGGGQYWPLTYDRLSIINYTSQ